jgi:hypothetical protein
VEAAEAVGLTHRLTKVAALFLEVEVVPVAALVALVEVENQFMAALVALT